MVDQLDLFATTNCDFEEEKLTKARALALQLEKAREEKIKFFSEKLTPRQQRLRNWLEDNFVAGRWFSIEEICSANIGYELSKNPKSHDKCVALGADIKKINWAIAERYKIILKDRKTGACKLCESEEEFNAWRQFELDLMETKWKYLNNLKWKSERDGTVPIVNLNGRALSPEETKVVNVYKQEDA